ncbi:MAG: Xaa-Pro peptidase family protein [Puniceicoccales bacterium]|jgi:Xaa-Pro aminopeptidase|nr:Xaa-Pro peptidase family protein [Puniceicoccales bacterium]
MDAPLLIFSNTKKDSDLLYLIGTHVPDHIAIVFDGQESIALVSALEINRLRNTSKIDKFVSWDVVKSSLQSAKNSDGDVLKRFLQDLKLKTICVKRDFPIYLADQLRSANFEIIVAGFSILPQRLIKSDGEITEIKHAIDIVRQTFVQVESVLLTTSINGKNELVFEDEILTSKRLRTMMETFCYRLGAVADDTIVACGIDACDPHNLGYGPLKANEFILIDFFPHLKTSGYYADVSRTFIKGKPTKEQANLYNVVKAAHDIAIDMAHGGVQGEDVMVWTLEYFESKGYKSSNIANPPHGMFHSLGHGLGLDIHEPPRIGMCDDILHPGMVVTIEPGLYYPTIGGVRVEDDILIRDQSSEILTQIPHNWIIE